MKFMNSNLPLSPVLRSKRQVEGFVESMNFDALVCGSDQVWLTEAPQSFDPVYFLDIYGQQARKVAYAPSVGFIESFGENSEAVGTLLSQFDAISARDSNTENALREVGFGQITRVLDPTLLVNFKEFVSKRPLEEDYLVVCGDVTVDEERYLERISELSGYKIVAIGTKTNVADYQKKYVNQQEWFNYIFHSAFVVTTLFHGLMIALNLRKPFVAIENKSRTFKLKDILSELGFENKLINPTKFVEKSDVLSTLETDYSKIETGLQERIIESESYLVESIAHGS